MKHEFVQYGHTAAPGIRRRSPGVVPTPVSRQNAAILVTVIRLIISITNKLFDFLHGAFFFLYDLSIQIYTLFELYDFHIVTKRFNAITFQLGSKVNKKRFEIFLKVNGRRAHTKADNARTTLVGFP